MRFMLILVVVSIAGCASTGQEVPAGMFSNDDGFVRVEKLGSVTEISASAPSKCLSEQTLMCRGPVEAGDCRCTFVYESERQLDRIAFDRQRNQIRRQR